MSEKNEALRLADALDDPRTVVFFDQRSKAAVELRFLHAENEALRRERDEARRTVREAHEAGTRLTAQRDALLEALEEIHQATMKNKVVIAKYVGISFLAAIAIRKAKEGK